MAGKEDVFGSPATSKSFDFTDEEKIYKWYLNECFVLMLIVWGKHKFQKNLKDFVFLLFFIIITSSFRWESQEFFKPNFDSGGGDPFVISMPPPNVTGSLHMGHAMFVTLEVGEFNYQVIYQT